MRRVRQGTVQHPQDLETEERPDEKIKESELTTIEREANKKKRKRVKAQLNGDMISPLNTTRPSTQGNAPANNNRNNGGNNPFNLGDGEDDDMEQQQAIRDQIMVDQLVDNPMQDAANAAGQRERILCCGLFRIRRNGHLDIICIKDLDQDFLFMLLFVIGITVCLSLYATYVWNRLREIIWKGRLYILP